METQNDNVHKILNELINEAKNYETILPNNNESIDILKESSLNNITNIIELFNYKFDSITLIKNNLSYIGKDDNFKVIISQINDYESIYKTIGIQIKEAFDANFDKLKDSIINIRNYQKEIKSNYLNYKNIQNLLQKGLVKYNNEISEICNENFLSIAYQFDENIILSLKQMKNRMNEYMQQIKNFENESINYFTSLNDITHSFLNFLNNNMINKYTEIIICFNKTIQKIPYDITDIETQFGKDLSLLNIIYNELQELRLRAMNMKQNNLIEIIKILNSIKDENNLYSNINQKYNKIYIEYLSSLNDAIGYIKKYVESNSINLIESCRDNNLEEEAIEIPKVNKDSIDIMFIMDITVSMQDILDALIYYILDIDNKLKTELKGVDIRYGFIGYRDYVDYENKISNRKLYEKKYAMKILDFNQDIYILKQILENLEVSGGGDDAEDVAGGLNTALSQSWKSNSRIAFLIADAPAHGAKYHENDVTDDYKKGDKYGLVLENIIYEYINKNINLCVIKIDDYNNKMYSIFSDIYLNKSNVNKNSIFINEEYITEKDIYKIITDNSINIYFKFKNNSLSYSREVYSLDSSIDIIFIVDLNIKSLMKKIKEKINYILYNFKENKNEININLGLISFQNYNFNISIINRNNNKYKLINNIEKFLNGVNNLDILSIDTDNNYYTLDFVNALNISLNMDWKSNTKIIILFLGESINNQFDLNIKTYINTDLSNILKSLAEQDINLFIINTNNSINIIYQLGKQIYNNQKEYITQGNIINFSLEKLNNNKIIDLIIQIYEKYNIYK